MKSRTRVVVIGGGVVGCSALYHLTRLGWSDVALLERDELTAGSTWHAAGNCPNFATSWHLLRIQTYSTELDGIRAGLWDPLDGDIDPAQLTQALAKGARERGAAIHRRTPVIRLEQ